MARSVEQIFAKHEARLMAIPGVEGIGIGGTEASPEIIVMVRSDLAAMRKKLPANLEGYPVKIELSGEISAP